MADNSSSGSNNDDDQNNPEVQQQPPPPQMPAIFLQRYRDDEYMMYDFKTRECPEWLGNQYPHEPSVCPLLHQGHKRRRDPREFKYSPSMCPNIGNCEKGEACGFYHNIYEYCLHPKKFRRSRCKAGANCDKYPCMFAHNPDQLLAAMKPPLPPPPRPKSVPLVPLPPLRVPLPHLPPPVQLRRRSRSA